ncbi:MAG TPA: C25 family cysteine peptidase [Thermoanaerobaculia bacterium]
MAALARQRPIETGPRPRGLGPGVDEKDLAQTGWGVLFAQADESATEVRHALRKLLEHRRRAAAATGSRYREYLGRDGYRPNETKRQWLARHRMGPGVVDPDRVPYYILIVGSPELIPYEFQYQLDAGYAVGRIHFSSLEEYERYAESVVCAELSDARPREAVFFAPGHEDDRATKVCTETLVEPLAKALAPTCASWRLDRLLGREATKDRLLEVLGREQPPALLFTAGHGVGFRLGYKMQLERQGELVCADWPGRKTPVSHDYCLSAADLGDRAHVHGLVTVSVSCYGAGTPARDDFSRCPPKERARLAPFGFVARLPQRLLAHPNGGALAYIGHVERVWEYSYFYEETGPQIQTLRSVFEELLSGFPVGAALKYIHRRLGELAIELKELRDSGEDEDDVQLSQLWISANDCRNYAVLGDPAVRLRV